MFHMLHILNHFYTLSSYIYIERKPNANAIALKNCWGENGKTKQQNENRKKNDLQIEVKRERESSKKERTKRKQRIDESYRKKKNENKVEK